MRARGLLPISSLGVVDIHSLKTYTERTTTTTTTGFVWSPEMVGWAREELPVLSNLAGPIQHFRAAILEGWRSKVSADLCARKGFRGGPWLGVDGSLTLNLA